ncbi:MAG TPA: hypothetical protein VMM92_06665 [Thermoanaerobaculia bacterium]|nr:hypothetical protein [Thermoanaerobaculia bacterium]
MICQRDLKPGDAVLRDRLRAGDPASGESLPPEVVWRMRQRLLASLPERRRAPLRLVLASAGTALVALMALVAGLALHREMSPAASSGAASGASAGRDLAARESPAAASPDRPSPASRSPRPLTPSAPPERLAASSPSVEPHGKSRPRSLHHAARHRASGVPGAPAPAAESASVLAAQGPAGSAEAPLTTLAAVAALPPKAEETASASLQIQFATPGGTRILWVLTPKDRS